MSDLTNAQVALMAVAQIRTGRGVNTSMVIREAQEYLDWLNSGEYKVYIPEDDKKEPQDG